MSTAPLQEPTRRRPPAVATPDRPHLAVVRTQLSPAARPSRPGRAPFVLLIVGLLAGGLFALLMLNTTLAENSFVVHDLQRATAELADREQALDQEVALAGAPHVLAERARGLGMVPNTNPVFLDLRDRRVLGVPQQAVALPTPKRQPPSRSSDELLRRLARTGGVVQPEPDGVRSSGATRDKNSKPDGQRVRDTGQGD